jgi:hypothetical protein
MIGLASLLNQPKRTSSIVTKLEGNLTVSLIIGSTRQGRFSEKQAHWILQQLS